MLKAMLVNKTSNVAKVDIDLVKGGLRGDMRDAFLEKQAACGLVSILCTSIEHITLSRMGGA